MTEEPLEIARRARLAARRLASLSSETKDLVLRKVADGIDAARDAILEANQADVLEARTTFEEVSLSQGLYSTASSSTTRSWMRSPRAYAPSRRSPILPAACSRARSSTTASSSRK